jgi:anti-anti-sigma regulatory factor
MLKIQRSTIGEVVFKLSGRMEAEHVPEFGDLLASEKNSTLLVLDLKDLTLVDGDVVAFLHRCETDGIRLRNCPAYIREWITRRRAEK